MENFKQKTTEEILEILEPHRNINHYPMVLTTKQRLEAIKELHSRGALVAMSEEELTKLLRSVVPTAPQREERFRVAEELSPNVAESRSEKWKSFSSQELVTLFRDFMISNTESAIRHATEVFYTLSKRGYANLFGEKGTSRDLDVFYSLKNGSGIYSYVDALINLKPKKLQLINALEYLCQGN